MRVAVETPRVRPITDDFGFNGSPFYVFVRQLDPSLHLPLGPVAGWVNLAWQLVAVLLLAWIAGEALGLDIDGRLAACALLFAAYDFTAYALPGLVFGELWVPIAVAVLAMRRRRAVLSGSAVAWAGLLKLFPFVLLLPAVAHLFRSRVAPRATGAVRTPGWCARFIVSCMLAVPMLGALSLLGGQSWGGFLHKIGSQFGEAALSVNSVSLGAALQALGLHGSPANGMLSVLALGFLATMFVEPCDDGGFFDALPRRALVLLAALGWVTHGWLNYYALLPCVLLPLYARSHRSTASVACLALAGAVMLPGFGDPALLQSPALRVLKLVPYLLVPAWMVSLELRPALHGVRARRLAGVVLALAVTITAIELWRVRTVDALDRDARTRLAAGEAAAALERLDRLVTLAPHNATAHMNRGIALAALGRTPAAAAAFEQAAKIAPDFAQAADNYGRFLMAERRFDAAVRTLERAHALAPNDPEILTVLARLRLQQGRRDEAIRLLERALELQPENASLRGALHQLLAQ